MEPCGDLGQRRSEGAVAVTIARVIFLCNSVVVVVAVVVAALPSLPCALRPPRRRRRSHCSSWLLWRSHSELRSQLFARERCGRGASTSLRACARSIARMFRGHFCTSTFYFCAMTTSLALPAPRLDTGQTMDMLANMNTHTHTHTHREGNMLRLP